MDFNGRVTRVVLKDFLQTRLSHPTDISNLFENVKKYSKFNKF
jgi:hypothetical protein